MAMLKLFKSTIPSCNYVFKSGKYAHFINGRYMTEIEAEIKELEEEIAQGHPQLFIDVKEKEVDSEQLDPLAVIKQKAIDEYIATQKEAVDSNKNMGTTESEPIKPASSSDIASATAGAIKVNLPLK